MMLYRHKQRYLRHIAILQLLINRIPGSRLLISSLPGLSLRTHVDSSNKPGDVFKHSQSLAWLTEYQKDTYLVFSIYMIGNGVNYHKSDECLFTVHYLKTESIIYMVDQARLTECMLNCSASLAMSTSILKALPGKLNIKRHSPSIIYLYDW